MSFEGLEPYFIDDCRRTIARALSLCLEVDFETARAGVDVVSTSRWPFPASD